MKQYKINLKKRSLSEVVPVIVEGLVGDDWCGFVDEQGGRRYFVIGFDAYKARPEHEGSFNTLEVPSFTRLTPVAEWFVRSQLADAQPNYLQRTRERLVQAGVPADAIDEYIDGFISGDFDRIKGFRFNKSVPAKERLERYLDFTEALDILLSKEAPVELDETDKEEIEVGRQKLFLTEISRKYSKMVERGFGLDPVAFPDAQLVVLG
ncbi:MAG: hypothetical protein LAP13_23700 [Acidobacteriia bacterium]|nr:hypothetical protein [Terriglobia bacterium]